jgi:hypothetical protein
VPMAAMAGMMENMAPGQEKRMIPVLMEDRNGQAPRRWWRTLGRH